MHDRRPWRHQRYGSPPAEIVRQAIYLVRRLNDSPCASVRALMRSSEASTQLVTLVGKNSNSFTFFVSNALMTAISPSSTVGRVSGQTFAASVLPPRRRQPAPEGSHVQLDRNQPIGAAGANPGWSGSSADLCHLRAMPAENRGEAIASIASCFIVKRFEA
jgi:hypothetical protein